MRDVTITSPHNETILQIFATCISLYFIGADHLSCISPAENTVTIKRLDGYTLYTILSLCYRDVQEESYVKLLLATGKPVLYRISMNITLTMNCQCLQTMVWSDNYIFPVFLAAAPRNGVIGRPVLAAPIGNFFLSAGFSIYTETTVNRHNNNQCPNNFRSNGWWFDLVVTLFVTSTKLSVLYVKPGHYWDAWPSSDRYHLGM